MPDGAAGKGSAADAAVEQDDTYAAKLRKDQATEKRLRIEAAERSLEQAKKDVEAAKDAIAVAKKENA